MEPGPGAPPSPPPRYNAPRSALYAAKGVGGTVVPPVAKGITVVAPATTSATAVSSTAGDATAASPVVTGIAAPLPAATSVRVASPTTTGITMESPMAPGATVATPTATGITMASPHATGAMTTPPITTNVTVTSPTATGVMVSSPTTTRNMMVSPVTTSAMAASPTVPGNLMAPPAVSASPVATGTPVAAAGVIVECPVATENMVAAPATTCSTATWVATVTGAPPAGVTTVTVAREVPMGSTVETTAPDTAAGTGILREMVPPTVTLAPSSIPVETMPENVAATGVSVETNTMSTAKKVDMVPVAMGVGPSLVVVAPSPATPPEPSSPTVPSFAAGSLPHGMGSQSSLGPGVPAPKAPDTLSYLDSVSLMSGTMESLTGTGFLDDASSLGSDSEINGLAYRKTDRYGFLGGSQYSVELECTIPVDVARQRELKWLDMFVHWDKWLSRRFQKVKLRCRKGIPSSLRAKAWQLLSNSKELLDQNSGKFEELDRQPGDPKWLDVIEKDLHRQFPFHEMFAARGGHGQQDLYRILKAYTIYRPDEGYCQAQAPVAAVLLMHMPAEQAFWCLVQICEKYLPGYYSAGLEAIQLDGEIFFALLRRASPIAYRHLKKYKIDPILYMTEWFMCIFSRTLPWCSVLRVWDMFFCEGVKIVFRVGLVLLRHTLGSVDKLRSCQGMYETMEKLRNLPLQCMQEDFLIHEVINLPVTEALIERENTMQLKKWRENRGELQYKPSRRLHGSRAIYEECHRMNPPLSASVSLLSLTGFKARGSRSSAGPPAPLVGRLALSAAPPPAPAQGQVVSEGLHPALPSPTGNNTPLGGPRKAGKDEKRKEKEREKQERLEKEKQKEHEKKLQKEREKQEKERERQEKERERRLQKERAKEEAKQKKERKLSMRKKEPKSASTPPPPTKEGRDGETPGGSVLQDTYF
uniref:TBC1 domain family member 10B n=1 Tax=Sphenodon punctatus TaxID=8508 RepID=A0A8D0H448_SPHPU